MKYCGFIITFVAIGLIHRVASLSRQSTILFENNQFKNVVIAIHDSVAEDRSLLTKLKDTMTKASTYLYKATRQRAYLKEIKILLPSTWSNDASYGVPTKETINLADVVITNTSAKGKRSIPQARSYDGCGKQGIHVLLTHEFLSLPRVVPYYNDPAKYFIHAFAQFRWGVFQEYAEEGETAFYFSLRSGRSEAIRCVYYIRGLIQKNDAAHTICYPSTVDQHTGLYPDECLWRPYPTRQVAKASLMDFQWIPSIETFCDDNTTNRYTIHNYETPSKHNRLCNHRSTWDIISNSDDFKGGINQPVDLLDSQLKPTFTVLRRSSKRKRRAVVMVNSDALKQSDTVKTLDRFHHEMSLNNIETEVHPLVSIEERFDNHVLGSQSDVFDSHVILVNTYMDKNELNYYNTKNNSIKTSSIWTHGELGRYLQFPEQSQQHKGAEPQSVYAEGRTVGHSLLDKLRHTILSEDFLYNKHAVVKREDFFLTHKEQLHTDFVEIDGTLGYRTVFLFHYDASLPSISLISPSGDVYNLSSSHWVLNEHLDLVQFNFKTIERGTWVTNITSVDDQVQLVSLTVISEHDSTSDDAIFIRTSVTKDDSKYSHIVLHADVTHGVQPVIGLSVIAKIETPSGYVEEVVMLDNGVGADIVKNDGVYSRYFTKSQHKGFYHITFIFFGKHGSVYRKEEHFMEPENNGEMKQLKKKVKYLQLVGNIQRHVTGESLYHDPDVLRLKSERPDDSDEIPPARITDLKVAKFLPYRNTIVLTWTAPGDDMDTGKLSTYELFIGENITDVRQMLTYDEPYAKTVYGKVHVEIHDGIVNAAETEVLLWDIKTFAISYAFAIRGVDLAGKKGAVSNVATFGIGNKYFA